MAKKMIPRVGGQILGEDSNRCGKIKKKIKKNGAISDFSFSILLNVLDDRFLVLRMHA